MRCGLPLLLTLALQAAVGQSPTPASDANAKALVREGVAAQQRGDSQTAIQAFRKALATDPAMVEAHVALGEALAASGQMDAAIEEDSKALALAPENSAARTNLGLAYFRKGDTLHAREQLETLHAARPTDVPAAVLLGYVYIKLGRAAEVVDLLKPLEPGHESNMDLEYVLAFSMIQSGNDKEGDPRMERVAQAKHSASAYVIAGSAHLSRSQMADARTDLTAALKIDPSIPGLSTMIGQAEYGLGNMAAATAAFQVGLRADPRDFNANLDLGAIRLKENKPDEARPLLELALELQPTVPLARLEMAKLDELSGRYADAVVLLEALVKAEPDWMDPHWDLANAYYELNRPEEGRRERSIAQELKMRQAPDTPMAK
jgi:tetratricopeptide (TPR) repeat protein